MKKKLNKIISAILLLASLISMLSVFAYASDEPVTDTQPETGTENEGTDTPAVDLSQIELLYNRNFEEGWDYNNGFTTFWVDSKSKEIVHKSYIDFEENIMSKYNYFWRIEASDSTKASATTLSVNEIRSSGTVVKFKIKADDACNLGRIMYMTTPGKKTIELLYISGNTLYAFKSGVASNKIADLSNEWLSVSMVFDWDAKKTLANGSTTSVFKCTVYYGDEGEYFEYETDYGLANDVGMTNINIGLTSNTTLDREGMSFCLDDFTVYQKTKDVFDFTDVTDKGSKVNTLAPIVVDIQDGPGNKSAEQIINEALCLKIGVDNALVKNQKQSIEEYCTPEIVDGHVMIPLKLFLNFINYPFYEHGESYDITTGTSATYLTIGRDSANVDGVRIPLTVAPGYLKNAKGDQVPVIAAEDIPRIFPGWLLTYDDMGLIIIYSGQSLEEGESLISRENDLDTMLTIMKKFIFDTVTTDENGKEFDEIDDSYTATGKKVIEDVIAKSPAHPYIFTNQEKFDNLYAVYTGATADAKAQKHLFSITAEADAVYAEYTGVSAAVVAYPGIKDGKEPVNVYGDGKKPDPTVPGDPTIADTTDGYTPEGTLEAVETYSSHLVTLAFAYQVTRNTKYADLAYDIAVALGQWTHWGPASMEHCATATGNFAIAFDWLYNYYVENKTQENVDALAEILYSKGVKQGYNSSAGKSCEFPRSIGGGDVYTTLNTYVNAVSSSNMIIGALALANYSEYNTETAYLIGNNIQNLVANGLDQYAPDGSYAESALMWADATNGFVKLIMALESSAGTTYGFENTWGLDKTFYFACYIEDSDGKIWNYHEGGADGVITGELLGIDTQMFNYAGKFLNDPTLVAIRKNQLEKGKAVTIFDMLFYSSGEVVVESELQLDYHMEGIDAFVSRSDWEAGSLYTGIMGGSNSVYGGQLDSGNFIYRNQGIDWIIDLGSDNEKIYSYNGAYRNHHYRHNAEGQNVIVVTTAQQSVPYGQLPSGNGKIIKSYSNEYGSYAIMENESAYGSAVSFANRGLLVTNNRQTVVIQDEMSFPRFQELTWIAHTAAQSISIDETGKVAYLMDQDPSGRMRTLRATIVSNGDYSFKTETCDPGKVLDATYKASDYKNNGGEAPYSRNGIQRLVIKTRNLLLFNCAVVFEMVESKDSDEPLGYSWGYMNTWNPVKDGTTGENTGTAIYRNPPVKSDIKTHATNIEWRVQERDAYTSRIADFYLLLTNIAYIVKTYPYDTLLTEDLMNAYSVYEENLNDYKKYIKKINESATSTKNMIRALAGYKGV